MDRLLQRKKSHRKTAIVHGIPSSITTATPDTPHPRHSIQTLYVSYLDELLPWEIYSLARILHVKNFNGSNIGDMERLMAALPPLLSSGRGIMDKLPKGVTNLPDAAVLCAAHKPLNGRIIRNTLNLVKEEIGWRLSTLIAYGEMTNKQRQTVNTVRDIYALWMKAAQFSQNIKGAASGKWKYVLSHCEACILSQIGADNDTLAALRTVLLSRTRIKSASTPPALLSWAEAWIDTGVTDGAQKVEIRYISAENSRALKEARKFAHTRRRSAEGRKAGKGRRKLSHPRQRIRTLSTAATAQRQKGPHSTSKVNADPFADPPAASTSRSRSDSDPDPENAIIDEYGNFLSLEDQRNNDASRIDFQTRPEDAGTIHPALRDSNSVEVADERGRFPSVYVPPDREAMKRKLRELETEAAENIRKWRGEGAARQAEEYRNLLRGSRQADDDDDDDYTDASVYSQDEEEAGGSTLVNSTRAEANRMTVWEDLYSKM